MKQTYNILTVGLVIVGFFIPLAWGAAVITFIFAISSTPPGLREDGKEKSGGLLGGVIDSYTVSKTMRDCPFCCKKIMKAATKCPYCQEFVEPESLIHNRLS